MIFLSNAIEDLADFSLFTPTSSNLPQAGLGLGRNSTFLESLFGAGKIASRTWSLFWGLEGGDAPSTMDGSLTLGGYDKAKTVGPNITQPFSSLADMSRCPSSFIVVVTDILVKNSNGTTTSLFGDAKGTALRTCIKPDIPLITFPSDIWQAFSTAIGGTYLGPSQSYKLWGMDYATQGVFDGDLQFVLSSGIELTVPNSQLVVPDVQIDTRGQMMVPNETMREILVYNLEDSNMNDMPLLGQVFLTSVYIHVDNEREQFTLWQANPTTEEELVTVQSTNLSSCNATSGSSGNSNDGISSASSKKPLSAGAIAGAVIGPVLVILTGLTFVYLSKRRKAGPVLTEAKRESLVYDTHKETVSNGYGPRHAFENMWQRQSQPHAAPRKGPQEVEGMQIHEMHPGNVSPRYELDGSMATKR
jgi:Eukaryotic aspartyl protease